MKRNTEDFTRWRKEWRPVSGNSTSSESCRPPDQPEASNIFRSKSAIWSLNVEPRPTRTWPQSWSMGWRKKVFRMGWILLTSRGRTLTKMRRILDEECMMHLMCWLLQGCWGKMTERKLHIIDSILQSWSSSSSSILWMKRDTWQFNEFSKNEMILKFFSNRLLEHTIWWKETNKIEISIFLKKNSSSPSSLSASEATTSLKSIPTILNLS